MLVIVPTLFMIGAFSETLALAFAAASTIYLLRLGRHDSIILLLVIACIFGDTRNDLFIFARPLRIVMMVILSTYSFWEFRLGIYQINRFFLAFMPFVAVSLLAMIFSPALDLAISKTFSFVLLYFVGLHYIHHRFRTLHITMLADIMYICHLIFFIGLILLPILPSMVSYGGLRYNGMLGNPNGMGLFIVISSPITVYVFSKVPNISKRYRNLTWFAILLSLALCSSRNSILSFSIFWLMYSAFRGNSYKGLIFIFVVGPIVLLFITMVDLVELVYTLGLEKYLRMKDIESGSGRVHAWEHATTIFWDNPLIGCGFACEEYSFIYKFNFKLWATGHQGGVHNSYLAFLVNTGIVGTGLYLGYIISIFRRMGNYRFTIPYLGAVAMSAIFESWLFSSLNPFHILFLCTMAWFLVDSKTHDLMETQVGVRDLKPTIPFIA